METIKDVLGRSPIHPFPARMAPSIALDAFGGQTNRLRVLDPMAGSGTVLAVARANGHRAFGVDADPLAVLLSRVWTTAIEPGVVEKKGEEVLSRARARFEAVSVAESYPRRADDETRRFVRFWFDSYARRQLTALSESIRLVRDARIRDVLWAAFSRLIISKQSGASLAMDLSHSRPHRKFDRAPSKPFNKFPSALRAVVRNCPQRSNKKIGPSTVVKQGDARLLPLKADSIDLVVTSPPYVNAIDYLRCSKFSLVWMGHTIESLRVIRTESIGTERQSSDSDSDQVEAIASTAFAALGGVETLAIALQGRLKTYTRDMTLAMREISRVTRPGGKIVVVIGDSTIRGVFVRNSNAIEAIARSLGLCGVERVTRELPPNRRYLPPPSSGNGGIEQRMRTEVVLTCSKART